MHRTSTRFQSPAFSRYIGMNLIEIEKKKQLSIKSVKTHKSNQDKSVKVFDMVSRALPVAAKVIMFLSPCLSEDKLFSLRKRIDEKFPFFLILNLYCLWITRKICQF